MTSMLALWLALALAQNGPILEATPWRVGLGEHKPALIRLDQLRDVLQAQGLSIEKIPVDHFPSMEIVLPTGQVLYSQRIGYGSREYVSFGDLVISVVEQGYEGSLEGWSPIRLVVGKLELRVNRIDPYVAYAYLFSKSVLGKTEYQIPLGASAPKRCLHTLKLSDPPGTVFALLTRKGYLETEAPEFEGEAFDIGPVEQGGILRLRLIESELRLATSLAQLKDSTTNAALIRFGNRLDAKGISFEVVKPVETLKATLCR